MGILIQLIADCCKKYPKNKKRKMNEPMFLKSQIFKTTQTYLNELVGFLSLTAVILVT